MCSCCPEAFLTKLRSYIKINQKLCQLSTKCEELAGDGGCLPCSDSGFREELVLEPSAMEKKNKTETLQTGY